MEVTNTKAEEVRKTKGRVEEKGVSLTELIFRTGSGLVLTSYFIFIFIFILFKRSCDYGLLTAGRFRPEFKTASPSPRHVTHLLRPADDDDDTAETRCNAHVDDDRTTTGGPRVPET